MGSEVESKSKSIKKEKTEEEKKEYTIQEHAKFLRRTNMSIQEQINNMDNFKENLTMKFHRNQELIENDQAVWEDFLK